MKRIRRWTGQLLGWVWRHGVLIVSLIIILLILALPYLAASYPVPDIFGIGPSTETTTTKAVDGQGKVVTITTTEKQQGAKTYWDLAGLLLIPLVLALGGIWFNQQEKDRDRQREDTRTQETRNLETERAREATLQAYLDQMTQLLLDKQLRESDEDAEVRSVARAQTLTTLRTLDEARKGTVLNFLYEARLIGRPEDLDTGEKRRVDPVISLYGADLKRADLVRADLSGAKLPGADLREADFRGAKLRGAILHRAILRGAKLRDADLTQADLTGAYLRDAHLAGAKLRDADLTGAHLGRTNLRDADLTGAQVTPEQLAIAQSVEGAKLPFDLKTRHVQDGTGQPSEASDELLDDLLTKSKDQHHPPSAAPRPQKEA